MESDSSDDMVTEELELDEMSDETFFTRQVKCLLTLLALAALATGFGVRYGGLPEQVAEIETADAAMQRRIDVDHARFNDVLEDLGRQSTFTICKDNKDPVIRRLLRVNCATPEARRAEEVNGP